MVLRLAWAAPVAPFTGAWIEMLGIGMIIAGIASLPSRERGLKSVLTQKFDPVHTSLPSRERGLKFSLYAYVLQPQPRRSLRGSVD